MTKAYKPVEQGGMGLDAEAIMLKHISPPPENFEDYNFDDYREKKKSMIFSSGRPSSR